MITWVFFDLGSTLIDETDCEKERFLDLLRQSETLTSEDLTEKYREYINKNQSPYKEIVKAYGLKPKEWPTHLEKIYESVPFILNQLGKKYHLGIIANQNFGIEQRLAQYGIRNYFEIIISSSEVGVQKPSLEIFKLALSTAQCLPDQAYMIGDRLDNDIQPATILKMHTIWVRQGLFADSNLDYLEIKPDIIVNHILEILNYL